MRKYRRNSGFTMAELLIVVAIIVVLSGVGFVAVQAHQKNLDQAERDTIAKELFFAAQNHLIMAESQNYPGVTAFGTAETTAMRTAAGISNQDASGNEYKDIYYVYSGEGGILDLMLPFGSIDETVRGGYYLIRYQKNPARVLDVFYWNKKDGAPSTIAYATLMGYRDSATRRNGDPPVGWYGGTDAVATGVTLQAPTLEIKNEERLTVVVTDNSANQQIANSNGTQTPVNAALELIVSGETVDGKTAKCVILLNNPAAQGFTPNGRVKKADNVYTVVLDDITTAKPSSGVADGMHFADLNAYADTEDGKIWFMADAETNNKIKFKPGEDITVEAVSFSNSTLASIAYSGGQTTNSLFAAVDSGDETINSDGTITKGTEDPVALIANFRHLENLDPAVSGLEATLANARQTADLVWSDATAKNGFVEKLVAAKKAAGGSDEHIKIYKEGSAEGTADDCYLPVSPTYALAYSGLSEGDPDAQNSDAQTAKAHTITGVKVGTADAAYAGAGGLFGAPTAALTVSDLALIDFDIHATGNAGALAGTLPSGSEVSNVIAYNSADFDSATATVASTGTGAAAGSAGGLIGSMTGAKIEKCAAALIVSSAGKDAGGLIGTSTGESTVSNSYSGGHVKTAASTGGAVEYDATALNVTAESGNAGGLIGSAGQAEISGCYSTCSVKGAVAGGLVGDAGSTIKDSYCTGLVVGASTSSKIGAFAGQLTVKPEECYYFEIINPIETNGVITYMPSVSGATEETYDADELQPLDSTATVYNDFVGTGALAAAVPYSAALADYSEYPLRPLSDVTAKATATAAADFVATHYGDWPMPEAFVVNTK